MSPIVADASVLIHLSKIGRFHLLKDIYGELNITPNVFVEVVEKGWGLSGSVETEEAVREGWVKVVDVIDKSKTREITVKHRIHLSNAETVQLAHETQARVLLADEEEVRELAAKLGLEVRGCLGLLIEAVRLGLIRVAEAERDAERLVEEGYRVSEKLLKEFHSILKSGIGNYGNRSS